MNKRRPLSTAERRELIAELIVRALLHRDARAVSLLQKLEPKIDWSAHLGRFTDQPFNTPYKP